MYDVQIFSFRLKDVLDDLLIITISDFKEVLTGLKLLAGKGKLINHIIVLFIYSVKCHKMKG